ncbi:MAG: hypothetical protein JOZ10_04590 [Acidobacteria bacterium]|nr:hypothetical protein [Acidobacteriota bacterium]MBV9435973.1 hypothetical protein [Acidobacteriota bacterium]
MAAIDSAPAIGFSTLRTALNRCPRLIEILSSLTGTDWANSSLLDSTLFHGCSPSAEHDKRSFAQLREVCSTESRNRCWKRLDELDCANPTAAQLRSFGALSVRKYRS